MQNPRIQLLPSFSVNGIEAAILRLDECHPVVSGNKWFKLRYYLADACANNKTTIASFGGAYSNHLVATAFAAKEAGLNSIGYVRAGEGEQLSATLLQAQAYGMELKLIGRKSYDEQKRTSAAADGPVYWIPEGGYGRPGALGAATMLERVNSNDYTHIICAAGTGTMMAGLIMGAAGKQVVVAISVLKNHLSLEDEIKALLPEEALAKPRELIHQYHFGGFAKHPPGLINYMRMIWQTEKLPTDIVYTGKMLFAAQDLVDKRHFPAGSRLLLIHSGGLQGNRSLAPGTLPF